MLAGKALWLTGWKWCSQVQAVPMRSCTAVCPSQHACPMCLVHAAGALCGAPPHPLSAPCSTACTALHCAAYTHPACRCTLRSGTSSPACWRSTACAASSWCSLQASQSCSWVQPWTIQAVFRLLFRAARSLGGRLRVSQLLQGLLAVMTRSCHFAIHVTPTPATLAGAVRSIVEGYTSEAGVRSLSRCLAAICRHVAVQVVQQAEEEGSAAPLLGGLQGASGGSGGSSREQPDLPPPLEELAARAAAATRVAANNVAMPPLAALRSMQAARSRGGGMLVQPLPAGRDSSGMRLWAQLLPLAGSPAAAAAAATATGGYPWRQLHPPARGNAAAGEAAAAAAQCTCPSRKQPRWFSWLRWARHDGTAEQAQQDAGCSGGGEAPHACSCAGSCGDPDCCCHGSVSRGQLGDVAGHASWGPPGEAGMAADSSGWEASWRRSALAREPPLLCGPGSMQVLRPPLVETMEAAGSGSLATAPRIAFGAAAAAAAAFAASGSGQQRAAGLALPLDGLPEAGGTEEQGWLPPARQQQHQQAIVVDDALIEAVLGPRRFEGHNSAGGRLGDHP